MLFILINFFFNNYKFHLKFFFCLYFLSLFKRKKFIKKTLENNIHIFSHYLIINDVDFHKTT